jgi:GT2 family glycosyltransferase
VEFVEDCVTPLCLYLDENPNVGCITPQQCNKDGEPVDSFSHSNGIRHELFKDRLFEILMPQKFPDRKKILFPKEVNHINGCFMLFPEKKFWTIGGFDTNIFLYCEEYDLAMRLKKIGAICCFHPGYRFLHLQGASTTKNKAVIRELYISRIYVYRKYHNLLLSSIYRIIILVKILVKPHKWHILPAVLRGEALSLSMKHRKC